MTTDIHEVAGCMIGDDIVVSGKAILPHTGVEVDLPSSKGLRFTVTDITVDNLGTAIHLIHVCEVTALIVDPDDIDTGKTTVRHLPGQPIYKEGAPA